MLAPSRAFVLLGALAITLPIVAVPQAWGRSSGTEKTLKAVDTDNDGVDLKEAQAAAEATFDKLEKDKDGTVDTKELQGRLSRKDLKAADSDNDGTLDAKELKTPAGKSLLQLLK